MRVRLAIICLLVVQFDESELSADEQPAVERVEGAVDPQAPQSWHHQWVVAKNSHTVIRTEPRRNAKRVVWCPGTQGFEVLELNGNWVQVSRGWVLCDDLIMVEDALPYFDRLIGGCPTAFAYASRAFLKILQENEESAAVDTAALADANEAVRLDPRLAAGYYSRAVVAIAAGRHDDAVDALNECIRLAPGDPRLFAARADLHYLKRGAFEAAIQDYDKAVLLGWDVAQAYLYRGDSHRLLSENEQALRDFDEAARRDPNMQEIYYGRGCVYWATQDFARAVVTLTEAVRLKPDDYESYHLRGCARYSQGCWELAIADATKSIEINPSYAPALASRGAARFFVQNYTDAIADCDEAIRLGVDGADREWVYRTRAAARSCIGDVGSSLKDCQKLVEIAPESPTGYSWCAWIWATSQEKEFRDGERALEAAKTACKLTVWKDHFAIAALAASRAEIDDFAGALADLKKSRELIEPSDARQTQLQEMQSAFLARRPFRTVQPIAPSANAAGSRHNRADGESSSTRGNQTSERRR